MCTQMCLGNCYSDLGRLEDALELHRAYYEAACARWGIDCHDTLGLTSRRRVDGPLVQVEQQRTYQREANDYNEDHQPGVGLGRVVRGRSASRLIVICDAARAALVVVARAQEAEYRRDGRRIRKEPH